MPNIPSPFQPTLMEWIEDIIFEADDPDMPMFDRLLSSIRKGFLNDKDFEGLKEYSVQTAEFANTIRDEYLILIMKHLKPLFFPPEALVLTST